MYNEYYANLYTGVVLLKGVAHVTDVYRGCVANTNVTRAQIWLLKPLPELVFVYSVEIRVLEDYVF